jgi:predicted negative regulator of RcsB-dependent stress response
VFLWGSAHTSAGIARCEQLLKESDGDLLVESKCSAVLAGLYGMEGRFDEARALVGRVKPMVTELGLQVVLVAMSHVFGLIEMYAQNPEAAEREFMDGYQLAQEIGHTGYMVPSAGFLARALCAQERFDEARGYLKVITENSADDDITAAADRHLSEARILAHEGKLEQAQSAARAAVATFRSVGEVANEAEALTALAEVLAAGGDDVGAAAAHEQAAELYDRKGIVPLAAHARENAAAIAKS